MAGTNIQAVRKALVTRIAAISALSGVQVTYSGNVRDPERERVYLGPRTPAPQEPSAMKGSGRVKRLETAEVPVVVEVYQPGEDEESAADRAVVLGTAIEEDLAGNYTLSTATGDIKALMSNAELETWVDDSGAGARLTYTVEAQSYLT